METLKTLLESHIAGFTLAKLLSALVLTAVCLIIVKLLMRTLNRFFERIQVPAMLMGMVRAITKVLLLFLVVLIVMGYLDIPVTSLVAAMSVVGLAVSLSVQNFLSNVTGGLQLLASRPFDVGDYVEAGGTAGTIREIGLFYTKLVTPDNKLIQLPNSTVVSSSITNYSCEPTRRVDLTFTASYDAPVEQVENALKAAIDSVPQIHVEPAPFARVSRYGNSSVEYTVKVWCANADYWDVYYDIIREVKTAFDSAGVEMTYDHVNVHIVEQ